MGTLPLDRADIDRLTELVLSGLTGLGHAHRRQDGGMQAVTLKRRLVTESGALLLLEVDTERLPKGVNAADLVSGRTLHHLSAVCHYPVKALNTTGVTLALMLDPAAGRVTLPRAVDLASALQSWPGRPYMFPLGASATGPVWEALRGHYLAAGETGSGKTTWVLATCLALARTTAPAALRMVVIDPKAVDLAPLGGLPHAAGRPVVSDPAAAAEILAELLGEIERRQRLFLRALARDLDTYNAADPAGGPLPRILVVIDELTDLVTLGGGVKGELYRALQRLVTLGRAFGLHAILATQYPRYDVVGTLVKGNTAGRLAFRVTTPEHSRVILGECGAERLPRVPGRFLAKLGDGRMTALQGYQVDPAELRALAAAAGPLAGDPAPGELQADGASRPELLLTDGEIGMLRYGLGELGGRFGQADLMAAGHSRREYRRLVGKLTALGLLRKDPAQGNALCLAAGELQAALDRLDGLDR